jgi:O-acetyl-ADP-ribose deacetylase (regulator of RNase III)
VTTIRAVKGDITKLEVDAIVNAANRQLIPGGGVDGAIHAAGGPAIAAETREIREEGGDMKTGEAVITTAGNLPANHVIHTAGPIWGEQPEYEAVQLLGACYHNSLDVAVAHGCRTVAFPNISTGVYGFPLRLAAETATGAVESWVETNPDALDEVVFVCFNEENHSLYDDLLD